VRVNVGALAAFPEQSVTVVDAGGREIGIVRWDGDVYALANLCTHQRGPLCRGVLGGRLTATAPGTMEVDDERPVIACPWHGWEFDVRTGRALWDDRYAVRTYPAAVDDDDCVVVEVGGREPAGTDT
jgi:nitrite reductase/ring-hydroxylating ferredoxin subunit